MRRQTRAVDVAPESRMSLYVVTAEPGARRAPGHRESRTNSPLRSEHDLATIPPGLAPASGLIVGVAVALDDPLSSPWSVENLAFRRRAAGVPPGPPRNRTIASYRLPQLEVSNDVPAKV